MLYSEPDNQKEVWYVMRALYRTELKTQSRLNEAGIETYIPIKETVTTVRGRKRKVKIPAVSNLIFVRSTQKRLAPFTAGDGRFQYTFKKGGMSNEPLIVPDKQMNDFIRACTRSERPLYFSPGELKLEKGTRVRIIGGPLDGYEGRLQKLQGSRVKRLFVELPGLLTAAVEVEPEYIQLV